MSNQKPRTIEEQIRLLRSRGMQFSNEEYAKKSLSHISYFRLKYYWTDMIDEETEHDFLEDTLRDNRCSVGMFACSQTNVCTQANIRLPIAKYSKTASIVPQ